MSQEAVLEDKIMGLMAAYQGGSLVVDTSALNYGPWETDPIRSVLYDSNPTPKQAQWPVTIMQETVALLDTFPSFVTEDVKDEAADYTQHIYHCRGKHVDEVTDWVVHHRTRLQRTLDEHIFNPFREEGSVAKDALSHDEYESNYTDARLVEAAYRLANVSQEPVTVVSADHEIVRYAKQFAGHERFDDSWEYHNVGFLQPHTVKDVSV